MQLGALRSPRYRRYWLGSIGSVGASQLLFLAQGWLVFELSSSPMDLGALGAAGAIPSILIMLFGGVLADRWDRRYLLMVTSLISAFLLLLQAVLDFSGVVEVWHVLVIAALIGIVTGLEWPTRQAFFAALISPDQMMSAVSLNSILWQGTRMILPAIGGVLIAVADTSLVFVICAVGFLGMFFTLLGMEVEDQVLTQGSSAQQFIEGIRFIATNKLFAVLIPLTWIWMFFGISYMQLMPAFADILSTDEMGFGMLVSVSGVGSVTGTIVVGPLQRTRHFGRIMLSGLLCATFALYGFGVTTGFVNQLTNEFILSLFFVFLVGLFGSVFLITSMTVLQLYVPDRLRGRVMGIHAISFHLISLGGLFGGAVASTHSSPLAVIIGASVILIALVIVSFTQQNIRQIDGRRLANAEVAK